MRTYHVKPIRKNTKLFKQGYTHAVVFRDSDTDGVLYEGLHCNYRGEEYAQARAEYLQTEQTAQARRASFHIVSVSEYCLLSPRRGDLTLIQSA